MTTRNPQVKHANTARYRAALRQWCLDTLGGRCQVCGRRYDLHFHHLDAASKVASITLLIRTRPALLPAEIAKCELLCDKHHRLRHYRQSATYLNYLLNHAGPKRPAY